MSERLDEIWLTFTFDWQAMVHRLHSAVDLEKRDGNGVFTERILADRLGSVP